MEDKFHHQTTPEELFSTWTKNVTQFWEAMTKSVPPAAPGSSGASNARDRDHKTRIQESWETHMKASRAAFSALTDPGAVEALNKGINMIPEISFRFLQQGIEGFLQFQKRWSTQLEKFGESSKQYDFNDLDREFLNRWTDIYHKEFSQFFNVPQVGLTRGYQEKTSRCADRFFRFQAAMMEFVHLLYLPIEKSFRILQEKLADLADTNGLPEDSKAYYQMWIKIVEGHYMALFKSSEYTQTMGKTIDALTTFIAARQEVLEDTLKSLPVPTIKDMDALYKEIHFLKRKIRELEKKCNLS